MRQQMVSGVNFIELPRDRGGEDFTSAVVEGLSQPQKILPCRLFYDSDGSQLFEQICKLPEYYLTRTEQKILEDNVPEMVKAAGHNVALVEFGSGSSLKTRLLINAALDCQRHLHYTSVDISSDFLRRSSLSLLNEYERLSITAIAAEYNDAIPILPHHEGPRLILFLGSNIGNFDSEEAVAFLRRIGHQMNREDRLLIGFDLLKELSIIEAAYNDAAGVTAAFNKNLLARINRELGGAFVLDDFEHAAPFVEDRARIEMRLISRCHQSAYISTPEQAFHFEADEYIHTENSHKYTIESFAGICHAAGLEIQAQWLDERAWFAVALLRKQVYVRVHDDSV